MTSNNNIKQINKDAENNNFTQTGNPYECFAISAIEDDLGSVNQEWISNSAEDFYQYLLNLMRKLDVPKSEIDTDQLIVELNWTDALQTFIDYAKNVRRSFRLHLIMQTPQPGELPY